MLGPWQAMLMIAVGQEPKDEGKKEKDREGTWTGTSTERCPESLGLRLYGRLNFKDLRRLEVGLDACS